jgi:hypothetical protein
VLIGFGEKAEFASEEYQTHNNIMENFVIIKKNPDYEPDQNN